MGLATANTSDLRGKNGRGFHSGGSETREPQPLPRIIRSITKSTEKAIRVGNLQSIRPSRKDGQVSANRVEIMNPSITAMSPYFGKIERESFQNILAGNCVGIVKNLYFPVGTIDVDFPFLRVDQPAEAYSVFDVFRHLLPKRFQ